MWSSCVGLIPDLAVDLDANVRHFRCDVRALDLA